MSIPDLHREPAADGPSTVFLPVAPPIPAELWGLWVDAADAADSGYWVPSLDDAAGGPTILVSFSESGAKAAADHQNETYGMSCRPVRVK